MKAGMTMQELACEVQRQREAKRDFVVDTRLLEMGDDTSLKMAGQPVPFAVRELAHRHLAAETGVPWSYYERMRTKQPDLLADNVNRWMNEEPSKRLVRVLDYGDGAPVARAVLSDRYRRLDYADLMTAAMPTLLEHGDALTVQSCQMTESRLFIKATTARVTGKVRGEVVQAGVIIKDSEVGASALWAGPFILTLSCLNGATMESWAQRSVHLGRRLGDDKGEARELYSDATLMLEDAAIWSKFRDVIRATLDPRHFAAMLEEVNRKAGDPIASPVAAVKVLAESSKLTEREHDGILDALANGGDLTRWGLSSAVTLMSQTVEDYERATELEVLGGDILTMQDATWKPLALAA